LADAGTNTESSPDKGNVELSQAEEQFVDSDDEGGEGQNQPQGVPPSEGESQLIEEEKVAVVPEQLEEANPYST